MITDKIQIRPRYGEVDKMGYVYHANYVSYCHQGRTELLRKYGINDSALEENNVMVPVISFEIDYKKPAQYDELLTIKTTIEEIPEVRFKFNFEIVNEENHTICKAKSTVVFINSKSRFPITVPDFVKNALKNSSKRKLYAKN
jgi:acyl-CoA thioester hydrolase